MIVLIRLLQGSSSEQSKLPVFRRLCDRAGLHVLSRERFLLPAWRQVKWRDFPFASFRAHVCLKRALAELMVRPPSANGHSAALEAFAVQVKRQRALDCDYLIARLRGALDVQQRRDLCNDIELLFETDRTSTDGLMNLDASPRDLMWDAQVVLSSLASGNLVEAHA